MGPIGMKLKQSSGVFNAKKKMASTITTHRNDCETQKYLPANPAPLHLVPVSLPPREAMGWGGRGQREAEVVGNCR